ncbi:MAG: carboxypeptidase regulatory-like domain-containing protein [Phycisphaerales bacterium]|nr:MAG: carboxypeptidase regulatory-like domain-containing protein [Phycisphaerales bacterium]
MNEFIALLNATGRTFVSLALPMLIQSSLLIVAVLALDLLLRRRVKAVIRYGIWLLVLVKLVLPPSLAAPTSLVYWIGARLPALSSPSAIVVSETPVAPPAVNAPEEPIARAEPSVDQRNVSPIEAPAEQPERTFAPPRQAVIAAAEPVASVPPPPPVTWQAMAFLAWLLVVAVMTLLLIQRAFFVRGLVAQSTEAPAAMVDVLDGCRRQMGLSKTVGLRLTSLSTSPSVCGLRKPRILMPQGMVAQLDAPQFKSVVLHELAHVKRGDLWVNLIQALLQIAYFFHPLLWLANLMIRRVREQAVDETVLAAMGSEAEDYPRTLLNVSKLAFGRPALSLRLIGVVESKKALTARIKHIVSRPFPKSAKLGLAGLVLVATIAAVLLPMAQAERSEALPALEAATADPIAQVLANGITVKLAGLCEFPATDKPAWYPDGTLATGMDLGDFRSTDPDYLEAGARVRVMVLELGGKPLKDVALTWKLTGSNASTFYPKYEGSQRQVLRPIQSIMARFHDDVATTDLKIGLAAGPWRSVASGGSPQAGGYTRDSITDQDVIYQKATTDNGSVKVTATHLLGREYDCRIIARGFKDELYEPRKYSNPGGEMRQCNAWFDLDIEKVKYFHLQARPHEWIEFKDIALFPQHKFDEGMAQQEVITATVMSSSEEATDAETGGPRTIHGIVADTLGRPRECVYVAPQGTRIWDGVMSDVEGRFTLEDVTPDQTAWIVYSQASRLYGFFTLPQEMPAEPVRATLNLDEADLSGRVVGADGKAVTEREVEVVVSTANGIRFPLTHRPKTDAFGYYSRNSVPCGAGLSLEARVLRDNKTSYSTVKTKLQVSRPLVEMPLLVASDRRIQPDFDQNLQSDGMRHCQGRVVDEEGKPIAGARIKMLFDMPGWMSMWVRDAATDSSGRWHRAIPPKAMNLSLEFEHPECYLTDDRHTPSLDELERGAHVVAMKRGLVLQGRVVNEQGQPVENVLVCAKRSYASTPSPYNQIIEDSTTARTGRDGTFRIAGLAPGERTIGAYCDQYAPKCQIVDIQADMPVTTVVLAKGKTYRGQVVDCQGQPIEGVRVGVTRWQQGKDWRNMSRLARTDAQGNFALTNLPEGEITLYYGKKPLMGFGKELPEDLSEIDVSVMYEVPVFTGRVVDAKTGEPIPEFSIINGIKWKRQDSSMRWSRYHRAHVPDPNGCFTHRWGGYAISYPLSSVACIKVQAPGYLPAIAPPLELGTECKPLTIGLRRGVSLRGTVLQPDGAAAAKAQVGFVAPGEMAFIDRHQFSERGYAYQADIIERADENGAFALPPTEAQGLIVAVHESGYAQIPSQEFASRSALSLTPWSRVEGTIDRARFQDESLEIALQALEQGGRDAPSVYWLFDRITPTNNTFALDCLPAIPLALARVYRYEPDNATFLQPEPGKTYSVAIGAPGRPVTGRILFPPQVLKDKAIELTDPRQTHGVAFRIDEGAAMPERIGTLAENSFSWLWRDKEHVYAPSQKVKRRFVPCIAEDGRFTFPGLEPGEYEFVVNIHAPLGENVSCGRGVLAGVAVARFTVPKRRGDSPLGVPDIRVQPLTYPGAGESAPLFEAQTFDDKTVRLADLRGKVVLLDFWASWCNPCVAKLPKMRTLHEAFADEKNFAMIGLSLDWDVEKARRMIDEKDPDWTQLSLGSMDESIVVKQYGVGGIPMTILIDADGTILARGADAEELKPMIEKALARRR